ncbi:hypothetical protein EC991_005238 [Linnemannia zychae]|nr:hypothetical protein EC991_005238 [Linnemannia zychae]
MKIGEVTSLKTATSGGLCTDHFYALCSYSILHPKDIPPWYASQQNEHLDNAEVSEQKDRANLNSQLEHLQSKYVGTGHADTSKYEWGVNQARDTYASYVGHYPMMSYFALAENESIARVKFNITEKMVQPCGPPPERKD